MKKIIPAVLAIAVIAGAFSASFNNSEAADRSAALLNNDSHVFAQAESDKDVQQVLSLKAFDPSADYTSLYYTMNKK